jgi:Glycosyl transferase family 2
VTVWSQLLFLRRVYQSRFAEALALREKGSWPSSDLELWSAYRVGLYRTVADAHWDGRGPRGGVAMAVSQAACGRLDAVPGLVERLRAMPAAQPHLTTLADALAPFMPELALSLVDHDHAPVPLRAALLLRVGQRRRAAELLQHALTQSSTPSPELHLLASNALDGGPADQIEHLNRFLAGHGLGALSLRNPRAPVSTGNLQPQAPAAEVEGPLVSVLMTAFNTADRVGAALRGLLQQTWKNLEVVVADDCSTDGTRDVVTALARQDARVRYLRLPCNAGTYVAKTLALRYARGEFVTCHDSDDWSHPRRIELQMQPLRQDPRVVATTSQWVRMEDNGHYYARPVHPLARLNPASPLFRRDKVEREAGLWDLVRTGADSEFHARLKLVFGRDAVRRLVQPLTIGAHRADSLMTAAGSGYDSQGMSPKRLDYWEGWTHWHIAELRAGRRPCLAGRTPEDLVSRPFAAPQGGEVPAEVIERCLFRVGEAGPE